MLEMAQTKAYSRINIFHAKWIIIITKKTFQHAILLLIIASTFFSC